LTDNPNQTEAFWDRAHKEQSNDRVWAKPKPAERDGMQYGANVRGAGDLLEQYLAKTGSDFADGFFRHCFELGIAFDDLPELVKQASDFAPEARAELEACLVLIKQAGMFGWAQRQLGRAANLGHTALNSMTNFAGNTGAWGMPAAKQAGWLSGMMEGGARLGTRGAELGSKLMRPAATVGRVGLHAAGGAATGAAAAPEGYGAEGALLGGAAGLVHGAAPMQKLMAKPGIVGGASKAFNRAATTSMAGALGGHIIDQGARLGGVDTGGKGATWGARLGLLPGATAPAALGGAGAVATATGLQVANAAKPVVEEGLMGKARSTLGNVLSPVAYGLKDNMVKELPGDLERVAKDPRTVNAVKGLAGGAADQVIQKLDTHMKSPEMKANAEKLVTEAISSPKVGQALMTQGKQYVGQLIKELGLDKFLNFFKQIGGGIDSLLGSFMDPQRVAGMNPFLKLAIILGGGMTLGGGIMGSPMTAGLGAAMLGGGLYGSGALDGVGQRLFGGKAPAQSVVDRPQ
jgi:hypothetical protein